MKTIAVERVQGQTTYLTQDERKGVYDVRRENDHEVQHAIPREGIQEAWCPIPGPPHSALLHGVIDSSDKSYNV